MANGTPSQEYLVAMNLQDATRFLIDPSIQYDNVLASQFPNLYKYYPNTKNKVKKLSLLKPGNMMQPKKGCTTWNPTIKTKMRSDELEVCSFETMGEMCADEFDAECLRNLQGAGNRVNDMDGTPELTSIEMSVVEVVRRGLGDDIYKIAWFGSQDFGTLNTHWHEDLSGMEVDDKNNAEEMLRTCSGFWDEIITRVALTDENEKIRYVDSNDGTPGGNATNPANIAAYLRSLRKNSSTILKNWKKSMPIAQRPVYLLQDNLYDAYIEYLQSLGQEAAYQLLVDGEVVPGVYMFDGYPVICVPEWDMYDTEFGAEGMNARAIFTAQENLEIAYDADTVNSTDYALLVQKSPLVKDKGVVWIYKAMKLGAGINVPALMTVGYNSSTTFA